VNIVQDYDAQLIIHYVIRADTRVQGTDPPSYIIEMKRQAEADFVRIIEKIHENTTNNMKKSTVKIKTNIIAYVRIADAILSYAKDQKMLVELEAGVSSKVHYLVALPLV
jgi:hypothetical protein